MRFTRTFRFTESPREEKTMKRLICTTLVTFVVAGTGLSVAPSAFAGAPPSCQGADTSTASGNCADSFIATSKQTTTSKSYQAVDTTTTTIVLAQEHIRTSVAKTSPKCRWFKWVWNSLYNTSGKRVWFKDYHVYGCPDKYSPTGWVKRGGGKSGKDCRNVIKVTAKAPAPVTTKHVIEISSFENWKFTGHVAVASASTANANAAAWCNTANSSAYATGSSAGYGSGSGSASFTVKGLLEVKSKLNSTEASLKSSLKLQAEGSAKADSESKAVAQATAQVSCSSTPPSNSAPSVSASAQSCVEQGQANGVITGTVNNPNSGNDTAVVTIGTQTTTVSVAANSSANFTLSGYAPGTYSGTATLQNVNMSTSFSVTVQQCVSTPQHFTNISCTSPEEVSGGGSFLVDCAVGNDNGAQITLSANSNDGNSRVSGINCISQGGTPACQGNGTFEFRVTGINDGSSVVSSSFTAVASSNGVNATYDSGQFPVDPSGGGF